MKRKRERKRQHEQHIKNGKWHWVSSTSLSVALHLRHVKWKLKFHFTDHTNDLLALPNFNDTSRKCRKPHALPCHARLSLYSSSRTYAFAWLQSVCLHMHWLTLWPNVQLEFNWKCIRNHVWVRKADRQTTRITAVCKYDTLHARWTCECSISAISKWHAREVCIFVLYFLMEKLLDERWTHTKHHSHKLHHIKLHTSDIKYH